MKLNRHQELILKGIKSLDEGKDIILKQRCDGKRISSNDIKEKQQGKVVNKSGAKIHEV